MAGQAKRLTLDEALTPLPGTCGTCGASGMAYPRPEPHGVMVCPRCTPKWVGVFALWSTNQARVGAGLPVILMEVPELHVETGYVP